ncbi:hypothetical protein TrVGV298_000377 [Trichoderma virens]|nr:hypothetical protein TrVGV298_000377 [Trichoderma virens]
MIQPFLRARPLAHTATLWALRRPQPLIIGGLRSFTATQVLDGRPGKAREKRRRRAKAKERAALPTKSKEKKKKLPKDEQPSSAEPGESVLDGGNPRMQRRHHLQGYGLP